MHIAPHSKSDVKFTSRIAFARKALRNKVSLSDLGITPLRPKRHHIACSFVRFAVAAEKVRYFSIYACHPCAGAMLIFSVSFQFLRMTTEVVPNHAFPSTAYKCLHLDVTSKTVWTFFEKSHKPGACDLYLCKKEIIDSCEIRTHAGCPNNLAGYRLNHSAKLSSTNYSTNKPTHTTITHQIHTNSIQIQIQIQISYNQSHNVHAPHHRYPATTGALACLVTIITRQPDNRWSSELVTCMNPHKAHVCFRLVVF
jgi:hypothetical protein